MRYTLRLASAGLMVACLMSPRGVSASCGQAFCTVDTRLSTERPLNGGQVRFDLSTEYIEQDEPWVGYHSVPVGGILRPDHQEVDGTNLTWKLNTEVALTDRWSVSLLVPIAHREHLHLAMPHSMAGQQMRAGAGGEHDEMPSDGTVTIGNATGVPERWNFTNLGDLQVVARYSLLRPALPAHTAVSLFAGLKLPTGKTDVRNDDGEEGEISMQPGTGSLDPLAGVSVQRGFSVDTLRGDTGIMPVFAGAAAHLPGSDGRFGFRPGPELLVNTGLAYPLTARLSALGQINFRYKDRDHVGAAPGVSREHTGGEYVYVSPGLLLSLAEHTALYSYVQVPVLQRVNGIQLVSRWNLLVGLTHRLEL